MTSKPTGTVTFLFTDIENSTQLAREHPETWEAAKSRHHSILREAIETNKGFVFQVIGDAFCSAFHQAGDALKAAVKAQQNLQNEPWDDITIYVRMGIHTGEAELDGNDYRGYRTLSFIQRLMSAGHGGQILVSNTAENLLREQLPEQIKLRDMGMQEFADVPAPTRVFQVIVTDLPTEFPPLRTINNLPNNLPTQLTSFVGREKELADVKRLLQNTHLLTLIGPGGTGKTRLSLEAAGEMLHLYPDGVWFVELARILDSQLVPRTTAIAIGLRDEPQRPVIDMLCDYLREKKILIVLDNCEHLVDACARMADPILRAAPDTRILASSREALGIGGEVTYRVPSLELPDISHLPPIESLSQYEAVKLFIDRAASAVPTFTVTNDNAPALAQVCHRLDGIPLAIELAAAKIRVLSVEQIAKRLNDRFRLLTGGSRTAMEHHQTLRAAIDWSYNLLSPSEQVLFQRLSVFVGGWTLEAAESVCEGGAVQSEDVLNLMEQLVNKSWVLTEEVRHEAHYHMLETIRQYAHEKLLETEDNEAFRAKHLAYFVKLVEHAEPELYRSNQVFWFEKLDDELDNFRTALAWASARDVESGLRIACIPWRFWDTRGYLQELGDWLRQLLQHYNIADALHAKALVIYSYYCYRQANFPEALKFAEHAFQLSRTLSDRQLQAFSLSLLGLITFLQGNMEGGVPLLEQSLAIYRALGNKLGQAETLEGLSFGIDSSEHKMAIAKESLDLYRELGNLTGIAGCLNSLSQKAIASGDFSSPILWLEEALSISRQLENQTKEASVLCTYGVLKYWQGNYHQANSYYRETIVLTEKTDDRYLELWAHTHMAYAVLRQGDIKQARELFEKCIRGTQKAEMLMALIYAIEGVASLYINQNKLGRAIRLFTWAEAMREKLGDHRPPVEQKSVDKDLVIIHSKLGDAEFAKFAARGRELTTEEATALALEPVEERAEINPRLATENNIPATLPSQREAEKQKYGGLTTREREVAAQIAQGKSNQAIAADLFLSLKTVEAHVTRILTKLGFTSRSQIAGWAVSKGLAEAPRDLETLGRED
jgi:predicted ATPase/class 3 adenylate cyclase/DNA-binding CsgD family transcriptional regulator